MAPNRNYTPEFRGEAVKWVLEQGLSLAEAAERLALPKGTLTTWVGTGFICHYNQGPPS